MSCDVILLAAFHPELAPLRRVLGDGMRARLGGLDVAARIVGIGLPVAATGAAMQLAEEKPRLAILLGTCGAYREAGIDLGRVVAPRRSRLAAPSVVDGLAQFPEPMSVLADTHTAVTDALVREGALEGDVATTLAITIEDGAASRIARATTAAIEHLEAHGVAAACAARGVPFAAALGVANRVGSSARDEWRANHRNAAAAAADVVIRTLLTLPPSMIRSPR
ncbi:MAG TPA: hypothetical protein VGG39_19990 [Polyangiaceae bacterium]